MNSKNIEMNNIPICHGYNLIQIQAIIGNQAIYINKISDELDALKLENERLKEIIRNGRLESADS